MNTSLEEEMKEGMGVVLQGGVPSHVPKVVPRRCSTDLKKDPN